MWVDEVIYVGQFAVVVKHLAYSLELFKDCLKVVLFSCWPNLSRKTHQGLLPWTSTWWKGDCVYEYEIIRRNPPTPRMEQARVGINVTCMTCEGGIVVQTITV